MDPILFQFSVTGMLVSPKPFGKSEADAATRSAHRAGFGIGYGIARMNRFHGPYFIIQAFLGLAFFLFATPALAQSAAERSSQSSSPLQTSAEIDQRLQRQSENLA